MLKGEKAMEIKIADVAELVDARDLKSLDGNVVWVRLPPPAPMAEPGIHHQLHDHALQSWPSLEDRQRKGNAPATITIPCREARPVRDLLSVCATSQRQNVPLT